MSHTDFTKEETTYSALYTDDTYAPFPSIDHSTPIEPTDDQHVTDGDTTTTNSDKTLTTTPDHTTPTTTVLQSSFDSSTVTNSEKATTLEETTISDSTTKKRKKRLLGNQEFFYKVGTTVSSFDKTAYPIWYRPVMKMLKGEKSKNLLTSLSDMDSDDYEVGDNNSVRNNESDGKEEADLKGDEEEDNSETESSQFIYGSAFVGAIIFSLVNFLFFAFAIIMVWSYAQELKWGSYYYNSQTRSYY